MPAIGTYASCEVLVWLRGGSTDECWTYTPEAGDLGRSFPARSLAQEVVEVDTAKAPWTEVCFVQFLSVARHHCLRAIKAAPHVPLLAGAGAQRQSICPQGQIDDGELTRHHGMPAPLPNASRGQLDVTLWPPKAPKISTPIDTSAPRDARRESEGVLQMPNKNAKHLKELEANARPRDIKFGAHGTGPSTAAEARQSRTEEASSSEDNWLGRERTKQFKKRVKGWINKKIEKGIAEQESDTAGFASGCHQCTCGGTQLC